MKMIYFEMRKSWLRIPILIALIILSALSVFKLKGECRSTNSRRTGDGKTWYQSAYKQYCGELSNEKVEAFVAVSNALSAQYSSGNYDPAYNDKYITGYLAGDYALFNIDIKPELTYALTYPNISNAISAKAYENVDLYKSIGMSYEAERNRLIYQSYRSRSIPEYRTTFWAEIFFNYDFSSLLCIVVLIAGLSSCFTYEKESGMKTLIIAANQRTKTELAKIASAAVYCAFLSVYFAAFDMIALHLLVGVDGLNMPIYSAENLQLSPFGFSFLSAFFLWIFIRFLSLFSISLVILFLSKISPNTIISVFAGLGASVFLIASAHWNKSGLGCAFALNPGIYITEFSTINFLGYPIVTLYAEIALLMLECVVWGFVIILSDKIFRVVRSCFARK